MNVLLCSIKLEVNRFVDSRVISRLSELVLDELPLNRLLLRLECDGRQLQGGRHSPTPKLRYGCSTLAVFDGKLTFVKT